MVEQWKVIPNTRKKYYVSNLGRVKSFYQDSVNGRMLQPHPSYNKGYLTVNLYKNKTFVKYYVHRLVATAFCRKAKLKVQVDHVNGFRLDNRAENLEWVTAAENYRRVLVSGKIRFLRSGEGTNRILTETQVIKIKYSIRSGKYTKQETADYYGVSIHTITAIMKGVRWAHIP